MIAASNLLSVQLKRLSTTIGIIGVGSIGAAFASKLAQAEMLAILSNSRGPDRLADLVSDIGGAVRAGTRNEAAAQDLVLVAINWLKLPVALAELPDFGGRIVIDANNPIVAPAFQLPSFTSVCRPKFFSDYVPGARVVKAFNHLPAKLLARHPRAVGGRGVLFFADADAPAKAEVTALIDKLGFFGVDVGQVNGGGQAISLQDPGI